MVSRFHNTNPFKQLDWITLVLYLMLLGCGLISIYASTYDFDQASIFSLAERSGKQILWIVLGLILGSGMLLIDDQFYETNAYLFYGGMMLLLLATVFLAPDVKGSRSWLVFGPVSLQPAEFAKMATSLALSRLISSYNFSLKNRRDLLRAIGLILLPVVLIIMQKETGSALVYFSLFLMLYREGMDGFFLYLALLAIYLFVIVIKFSTVIICDNSLGELLAMISIFIGLLYYYRKTKKTFRPLYWWLGVQSLIIITLILFSKFKISFPFLWIQIALNILLTIITVANMFKKQIRKIAQLLIIVLGATIFSFGVDYTFENILQPHQQIRIKVALGLEEDLRGAGYNVNQSKIAIGSGGIFGKGFLNGTQTKLKYVPEQDTDFIFCTVGEEHGFLGATFVMILFVALIIRIIVIAETQTRLFTRVYAYSVASILIFHLVINIGMVLGLLPVIGIPLPFISYGGSSLWGFTMLLFILLRMDIARFERY